MNTIKKFFLYAFAMLLCEGCDNGNSQAFIEDDDVHSLVRRADQLEDDYEHYFLYRVNSFPIEANPFLFIQVHIEGDNEKYLYLDEVTDSIDTDAEKEVKIYPKPEANVEKIIAAIRRAQPRMEVKEVTDNPNYILCTLPQIDETLKAELENSIDAFFRYVINEMKEIHLTYLNLIASRAEPSRKEELISECENEYWEEIEDVMNDRKEILQALDEAANPKLELNKNTEKMLCEYEKKSDGYNKLFFYKCACIPTKANIIQFLSVVVNVDGQDKNIDDVADYSKESDEYFKIVPKQEDYREAIKVGILQSNPLMQLEDKMDETPAYILCAMPEVDKNLRDTLNKLLSGPYLNIKDNIQSTTKIYLEKIIKAAAPVQEAIQEAKKMVDDLYNKTTGEVEINYANKKKEIADAYQRYCTTHGLIPEPEPEPKPTHEMTLDDD